MELTKLSKRNYKPKQLNPQLKEVRPKDLVKKNSRSYKRKTQRKISKMVSQEIKNITIITKREENSNQRQLKRRRKNDMI